ncbi:MAG: radical SAM protein [Candidatus Omnitrophota bacterium]
MTLGITPEIVVSDNKGNIYSIPDLEGAGMKAGSFFRLRPADLISLPHGSELFMLPDRLAVAYDPSAGRFTALDGLLAVAAFVSPGFTIEHNASYVEIGRPKALPLFSYGAVVFYKGGFHVAATRVDREKRQDLRLMKMCEVRRGAKRLRKIFPNNRLVRHLEGCALLYGCPAAKNFFLKRYEAPLPTSPYCNARCIGCISYQARRGCPATQPRIKFTPTPEEIAETALYHIDNVRDPVVSFGQGCEGEPLLAHRTIKRAIEIIRARTGKGMINMNTNASLPDEISSLFDVGLGSIRVSLNSARRIYYERYYKPRKYTFADVIRSIKNAKARSGFVSINYLISPGFTDTKDELRALKGLIERGRIDMIQWRNLNFDPLGYLREMGHKSRIRDIVGIKEAIKDIKREFPNLMMGYFNPSKARIRRFHAITQSRPIRNGG